MSHRALGVVADERGWRQWETTWRDDRSEPLDARPPPTATPPVDDSLESIVESLDFARFEGIYHRSDGVWTAYLACWLAVEHLLDEPLPDPRGDGAIVAVRSASDVSALRCWFRGAKRTVADCMMAGDYSAADARTGMLAALERRAGDRDVIVGKHPDV